MQLMLLFSCNHNRNQCSAKERQKCCQYRIKEEREEDEKEEERERKREEKTNDYKK